MGRLVNFYPASIGKAERHLEVSELKTIRAAQASQKKLADYLAALHECEEAEERVNEATTTETLPELKADHEAKTALMLALRAEHAELKSAEDKADQVEDEANERLGTLEDEYEAHKKRRKTASFK
jgi:hypothetical protein